MKKFALAMLALMALGIVLVVLVVPIGTLVTALGVGLGVSVFGMIMDERTEFADAVSVAAAAGTALIGDVIPLSNLRDIGAGKPPIYLVITTDTEIITGGAAGTIKFQLVSDAQAAIATDGTATVHYDTGTFVTDDAAANDAQLNAGGVIACVPLPMEGKVYEAFLGILCVIGTTTVTAGKINAFLTLDPRRWKAYPDAL
jgi:hypothetical protein